MVVWKILHFNKAYENWQLRKGGIPKLASPAERKAAESTLRACARAQRIHLWQPCKDYTNLKASLIRNHFLRYQRLQPPKPELQQTSFTAVWGRISLYSPSQPRSFETPSRRWRLQMAEQKATHKSVVITAQLRVPCSGLLWQVRLAYTLLLSKEAGRWHHRLAEERLIQTASFPETIYSNLGQSEGKLFFPHEKNKNHPNSTTAQLSP